MNGDYVHHLSVAGRSDIGLKRLINQDAYRTQVPMAGFPSSHGLFVVADGVGGNLPRGEVASRTAVDVLVEAYYSQPDDSDTLRRIQSAIHTAHEAVKQRASSLAETTIGTTLAGVVMTPVGEAIVFNLGDSRVYRFRDQVVEQISQDHVVTNEPYVIKDEFQQKRSTKVTAYLGQQKPIAPHFYRLRVQPDDVFVICTDGVWSEISDQEVRQVVARMTVEEAADHVVETIKTRRASDNLTLIIVRINDTGKRRGWHGMAKPD